MCHETALPAPRRCFWRSPRKGFLALSSNPPLAKPRFAAVIRWERRLAFALHPAKPVPPAKTYMWLARFLHPVVLGPGLLPARFVPKQALRCTLRTLHPSPCPSQTPPTMLYIDPPAFPLVWRPLGTLLALCTDYANRRATHLSTKGATSTYMVSAVRLAVLGGCVRCKTWGPLPSQPS